MFKKHLHRLLSTTPNGVFEGVTDGTIVPNMNLIGSPLAPTIDPATQASAASLANKISYAITFISGANAMTGFRLPRGFRGAFIVIPTGASTGATGGTLAYSTDGLSEDIPIGLNHTNVANRAQLYVSNGLLVYPSYV